VAEKQTDGEQMAIRLEYELDRLSAEKLAQAYELLVPERLRQTDYIYSQEVVNDEDGRHLLARLL
jgi:hypothetical protein